ncbi:MAG: hypothetical protein BJ554DRAFT_440 [Olpidium bornovanus]|uniref:Uncharacterized protein n=1 Tax=Olpidium bornovanus TaxID=278681 RepID=A0A8H8DIK7_9FUNG|nr:MAG: hypothetical protein BJ554DRAFT_440 [Olpidium bornovanus]
MPGKHSPLTFSRVRRSIWMTHFLRYTWTTRPSRPLEEPRTTRTSPTGPQMLCSGSMTFDWPAALLW